MIYLTLVDPSFQTRDSIPAMTPCKVRQKDANGTMPLDYRFEETGLFAL